MNLMPNPILNTSPLFYLAQTSTSQHQTGKIRWFPCIYDTIPVFSGFASMSEVKTSTPKKEAKIENAVVPQIQCLDKSPIYTQPNR